MSDPFAYRKKLGSPETVARACRRAQRSGKRVVFTNGCFDLLHPGHVRYLAAARAAGDLLVVGLNSDGSVRKLKGPGRPVQDEGSRAEVLAGLAAVDLVVIFDEPTPLGLILKVHPDVLAKGADWAEEQIVGGDEVKSWGGRVLRLALVPGKSTTALVKRSSRAASKPPVKRRSKT